MKKFGLVLYSLYLVVCAQLYGFCVEDTDLIEQAPLESVLSQGTMHEAGFFRALVSLLIVIGLIYLTAWGYKKLNLFNLSKLAKTSPALAKNKFKLISSQTLGTNKNLHVVEINNKYLVIGTTPNSVNLLKEFDKSAIDGEECNNDNSPVDEVLKEDFSDLAQDNWVNDMINKYKYR